MSDAAAADVAVAGAADVLVGADVGGAAADVVVVVVVVAAVGVVAAAAKCVCQPDPFGW